MGNVSTNDFKQQNTEGMTIEEIKRVNFSGMAQSTIDKTRIASKKMTDKQQILMDRKTKQIKDAVKKPLSCPQCKTKEVRYFQLMLDTGGTDPRYTCRCQNCGFGGKRNLETKKREVWDITREIK